MFAKGSLFAAFTFTLLLSGQALQFNPNPSWNRHGSPGNRHQPGHRGHRRPHGHRPGHGRPPAHHHSSGFHPPVPSSTLSSSPIPSSVTEAPSETIAPSSAVPSDVPSSDVPAPSDVTSSDAPAPSDVPSEVPSDQPPEVTVTVTATASEELPSETVAPSSEIPPEPSSSDVPPPPASSEVPPAEPSSSDVPPEPSTTDSAPPAESSAPPSPPASTKRGIAWADPEHPEDVALFANQPALSWVYNWSPNPNSYLIGAIPNFVPMQWNGNDIASLAGKIASLGAKEVLAFNEPDFTTQANMDPVAAAELWKQYIQPIQGVRFGAPAVTSAPGGVVWLRSFFAACDGCKFDFLPIHWYGEGVGNFYDYVWKIHSEFGIPLWITEYASTSSNHAENVDFLTQSIAYLDTLDFVERYAWFGVFRDDGVAPYPLIDANGALNDMGKIYLGL